MRRVSSAEFWRVLAAIDEVAPVIQSRDPYVSLWRRRGTSETLGRVEGGDAKSPTLYWLAIEEGAR